MSNTRAICYIPSIECLAYYSLDHWLALFEQRAGRAATEVCLPGVVEVGGSYRSRYFAPHDRLGELNTLEHWIQAARDQIDNAVIWVSVLATIPSLHNDENAIRDHWDQAMEDACISNPFVRTILATVTAEVRELGADGVVFDITDAYPNSTSARYPGMGRNQQRRLQSTCFCTYCLERLRTVGKWTEGAAPFRQEATLVRFVLKPTDRGATPIDVKHEWLDRLDAAALVEFSRARGFVADESDEGRQDALKLLKYFIARGQVTSEAVRAMCSCAAEHNLRNAILLGSYDYDQSQLTSAPMLLSKGIADELWTPNFQVQRDGEGMTRVVRFLSVRGSYYLNALFKHLDALSGLLDLADMEELVEDFCRQAIDLDARDNLNVGQCSQVEDLFKISGLAGAPFRRSDLLDLLAKMEADGSIRQSIRTEIVTRIERGKISLGATDPEDDPRHGAAQARGIYD